MPKHYPTLQLKCREGDVMLNETVKIATESFARSMNRRKFIKRAGGTIFAGLAALASGHALGASAFARDASLQIPECIPPGPYCNLNGNGSDPNGCRGAHCFQHLHKGNVLQCRVVYWWYQTGCWTTPVTGGYWVCCDCGCGQNRDIFCGCAQFSGSRPPVPTGPSGEGATG